MTDVKSQSSPQRPLQDAVGSSGMFAEVMVGCFYSY